MSSSDIIQMYETDHDSVSDAENVSNREEEFEEPRQRRRLNQGRPRGRPRVRPREEDAAGTGGAAAATGGAAAATGGAAAATGGAAAATGGGAAGTVAAATGGRGGTGRAAAVTGGRGGTGRAAAATGGRGGTGRAAAATGGRGGTGRATAARGGTGRATAARDATPEGATATGGPGQPLSTFPPDSAKRNERNPNGENDWESCLLSLLRGQIEKEKNDIVKENEKLHESMKFYKCCGICFGNDIFSHEHITCSEGHHFCAPCYVHRCTSSKAEGCTDDVSKCNLNIHGNRCTGTISLDQRLKIIPKETLEYEKTVAVKNVLEEEEKKRQRENATSISFTDLIETCEPRTPCCNAKYYDFEGCCSVMCAKCDKVFCMYCLSVFEKQTDCENHAVKCSRNPLLMTYANRKKMDAHFARSAFQKRAVNLTQYEDSLKRLMQKAGVNNYNLNLFTTVNNLEETLQRETNFAKTAMMGNDGQ